MYIIDNQPARIEWEARGEIPRILQNAKNLLMTHMGEVPYDRYRGFDPALYDRPIASIQSSIAQELDRIMEWEPDAEVRDIHAYVDNERGFVIEAKIEIDNERADA